MRRHEVRLPMCIRRMSDRRRALDFVRTCAALRNVFELRLFLL